MKILIIDDDCRLIYEIIDEFREKGDEVERWYNAVRLWDDISVLDDFDVIVLDMSFSLLGCRIEDYCHNLPGVIVFEEIRKNNNMPVVFFSDYRTSDMMECINNDKNTYYFPKSYLYDHSLVEYIHTLVL